MNLMLTTFAGPFAAAAAVVAVGFTDAGAVPVAAGTSVNINGTTVAADPNLAGTVLNDNLIPFSIANGSGATLVSGNLQNRVVRSDTLGTLIFAPRLRDLVFTPIAGAGPVSIIGLSVTPYGAGALDIDFRTDGLGDQGPFNVSRSVSGDLLTFRYDGLTTADGSLFPSILSTATIFSLTGTATIFASFANQTFSTTIDGLAVPAEVPLPAAAPLFLSVLAGGVAAARRRNKRA